jgi:hypothetical protein
MKNIIQDVSKREHSKRFPLDQVREGWRRVAVTVSDHTGNFLYILHSTPLAGVAP